MNRQKVVILVALVALLGGLLSVSAFAVIDPDFSVPVSDNRQDSSTMRYACTCGSNMSYNRFYVSGSSESACAFFASDHQLLCVSRSSGSCFYSYFNSSLVYQIGSSFALSRSTVVDGVTYYYGSQGISGVPAGSDYQLPSYNDLDSALSACISALNYSSPVSVSDFSFDLTAGNIAVIETSGIATDVYMSATMPDLSKPWIAGPEPDYWPDDLVTYGYVSSAPVAGSSLPSLSDYISWVRGSDRNLLGQTQSAVKNLTFDLDNNSQYLVIYNYPYYPFSGNNSSSAPTIHFEVEDAVSVVVYSGTVTASGTTLGEIVYTRTPEGSWQDSEGGNSAPPPGGGNYIPSDGDLFSVLTDLVSDIDSFFTGTWQYIRNIVDSLSGFPAFVVQLYSWLPQEFRVVIFSAFNIVVMIGVLKVML